MMDSYYNGSDVMVYFDGKPIGVSRIESFRAHPTLAFGSYDSEKARTFARFGTYTPTARQRELYAKKKKKSRHKKGR